MKYTRGTTEKKKTFVQYDYRFKLGLVLFHYVNLILLIITTAPKLQKFIPLSTEGLVLLFVPLVTIGVYTFGWLLDVELKYPQTLNVVAIERNPIWGDIFERIELNKATIEEMEKRLFKKLDEISNEKKNH